VLFIITFISIIIYGLLSEINLMDGWMDGYETPKKSNFGFNILGIS